MDPIPSFITPPAPRFVGTSSDNDTLPPDLLRQAAVRVRVAALVFAALWAFVLFMNDVVVRIPGMLSDGGRGWSLEENAYGVAGVVLFLSLAGAASRLRDRPELVIDLGLASVVVSALLIGVLTNLTPSVQGSRISWNVVMILVYPAIAPAERRKILIASLLAASMDPLGVVIAYLRGADVSTVTRDPFTLLWYFAPTYLTAFVATVPARVIRGLGRQVGRERELGSYRVGELLSRGGMGEVYRATHLMLKRPAAIKLIRRDAIENLSADAVRVLVERFRREAQVVASLTSVHTITLYDFGISGDGAFYHVMELLEGFDVQTLVSRFGPLPPERVIHLLTQACDSLAEAHAAGLVHRDIKPSNLFVCRLAGANDFLKVLDFGLVTTYARSREPSLDTLSAPGVLVGTPGFMAPELVVDAGGIDHRADLYALGCVAFWMLTGREVFDVRTSMAQLVQHVHETPRAPSQLAPYPIPAALDRVILDCLAKDARDRPRDADELARRLAACPVQEPWAGDRAAGWWASVGQIRYERPTGVGNSVDRVLAK